MIKNKHLIPFKSSILRFNRSHSMGLMLALICSQMDVHANSHLFVIHPHFATQRSFDEEYVVNQELKFTGVVKDEFGNPIAGVSVRIKNTSQETLTDTNGRFTIGTTSKNLTLSVSSLGYGPLEMILKSSVTDYNLILQSDTRDLDEVVVVGYGQQKKVNLTGAVSVVKGDDIVRQPVGQTSAALQGAAPGLTVTQSSGQPGRDMGGLRIRGIGTLSDSNPLVLIDGIEGNINNVNPNDIANISVLKDASSSAIYGSRAANGVILITTKRGSAQGFVVDYNNYFGISKPTDMTKMADGLDHMLLLNEAYVNVGRSPLFSDQMINDYKVGRYTDSDKYPDTDWHELTLKNHGTMQNHYVSVNGGGERARVVASLGYFDQSGILDNTNFRRYNLRLNNDLKISEKLSSSMDVALAKSELTEPSAGTTSIFHYVRRIPANQAGLFSNGQYGEGWNGNNPLAMAKDGGLNKENPFDLMLNLDLKYKPFDGLMAQVVYSPRYIINHTKNFTNTIQSYYADGSPAYLIPQLNSLTERFNQSWYNNFRAILTYDKRINDSHEINVMVGYQQEDQDDNYLSAYRQVFQLPEFQEINSGNSENQQNNGSSSQWALKSFFGRLNYNFQGKYLFEANVRRDGSSRFAKGNKYSVFPSFSAGWRLSEEEFMSSLKPVISELKIRGSWGKLGNQNIGLYPFASFVTLGANNYSFGDKIYTGAALNNMANSEIKWETTTVTDVGLDLTLWNKFNITADYYYRKTDDILLQLDIPKILGLNAPYQNAGVVENKGWDLSVNYRNSVGEFKYNVTANLSDVKNKVLDMRGVLRTGLTVNHEGSPIGSLYGYEAIGYFQNQAEIDNHAKQFGTVSPGDIKYRDLNEDGVINSDDQVVIGSPIPRYSYSLNLGTEYKGFDLSVFIQGVGKADGYIYYQGIMPFYQGGTIQEQHKDYWTVDNPNAQFPRLAFNETNNIQNSTFWMKSAAYLRVKNISLGYTLPSTLLSHIPFQSARVFVTGQNIFTSSKFWKGFDPEGPISTGGWYPQMKVYSVGLSVKFK